MPPPSSRVKQFAKCIRKNPEFESYLTGNCETPLYAGPDAEIPVKTLNRLFANKPCLCVVKVSERNGNHSIILVKDSKLKAEWSLFDPNGSDDFAFGIVNDDHTKFVTKRYTEVSHTKPVNKGTNTVNPGYCGIFGIIFMVYYRYHKNDAKSWLKQWKSFLNLILKDGTNTYKAQGKVRVAPIGLDIASSVQNVIALGISPQKKESLIRTILDVVDSSQYNSNTLISMLGDLELLQTINIISLQSNTTPTKPIQPRQSSINRHQVNNGRVMRTSIRGGARSMPYQVRSQRRTK